MAVMKDEPDKSSVGWPCAESLQGLVNGVSRLSVALQPWISGRCSVQHEIVVEAIPCLSVRVWQAASTWYHKLSRQAL